MFFLGCFVVFSGILYVVGSLWVVGAADSTGSAGKGRSAGPSVNRGKKRQLKSNGGAAWGKLLSQCSQVGIHFCTQLSS